MLNGPTLTKRLALYNDATGIGEWLAHLPLDAPEHVGDAHVVVVDDVGQVVRGEAVRLEDDGIALDGVDVVGGGAEDEVLEGLGARPQLQSHREGGPAADLTIISAFTHIFRFRATF